MQEYPATLTSAVDHLLMSMTAQQLVDLKTAKAEELVQFHFSLGLSIRNDFGLWRDDTPLGRYALETHKDPDAVSMEIIRLAWISLHEES